MLGDRNSLEVLLSGITQIPVRALRGRPLTDFTIKERLEWVRDRKTRREEDKVYCLQGIFAVVMIPHYGEGYTHAMRRFYREIQRHSEGNAPWNAELRMQNGTAPSLGELSIDKQAEAPPTDEYNNIVKQLQHSLKMSQEENGSNHPRTLAAAEKLGTTLQGLGDHEQAANEFRRALRGRELRKQQDDARNDLVRLACCSSALITNDTVSPAVARRVSDHYIYTRPVGTCGSKAKYFQEIAPIGFRVKALHIWSHDNGICGVQLDYSDGSTSSLRGRTSGQITSYLFEPGETVSEINTWVAIKLPYIECFEMETVRYEESGNAVSVQVPLGRKEHGPVSYRRAETGSGILVGVHGKVDSGFYQLGFIFLSPTHALAQEPVLDILNTEDRSKRYYSYDASRLPNLVVTTGLGGSGGKPFQDVAEGSSVVQKLILWTSGVPLALLRGIQVAFDDGTTSVLRGQAEGQCTMFKFRHSESITALDMGYGRTNNRLHPWYFRLTTSELRSFKSNESEKAIYDYKQELSPDGVLVGIHGYCEDQLDWLGFVFR